MHQVADCSVLTGTVVAVKFQAFRLSFAKASYTPSRFTFLSSACLCRSCFFIPLYFVFFSGITHPSIFFRAATTHMSSFADFPDCFPQCLPSNWILPARLFRANAPTPSTPARSLLYLFITRAQCLCAICIVLL